MWEGENGLVSIVCACAEYPTIRGVSDLYVNSPCNFPLYFTHTLVYCGPAVCNKLANCMSSACCVEQRLAFALQKVGKGRLTLKKEQLSAIRSAYAPSGCFCVVTYWVWQVDRVQVFTFLFHHNLNRLDGRTSSVVLVVSPTKACILGEYAAVRSKTTLFF